jgi:isocitrate lyase
MAALKPANPPISAQLPSDGFQLLPESEKAGAAEDALYDQQIKDVEAWWATPRYDGIKRPYTAADIVSKRGSQLQSYPSSVMARKLFNLIKQREAAGEPIHTSMYSHYTLHEDYKNITVLTNSYSGSN